MVTKKHIKITGTSEVSWKDAIVKTIDEVAKTIDGLCEVTVMEQKAKIENNKIKEYYVDLDICFVVDSEKRN